MRSPSLAQETTWLVRVREHDSLSDREDANTEVPSLFLTMQDVERRGNRFKTHAHACAHTHTFSQSA